MEELVSYRQEKLAEIRAIAEQLEGIKGIFLGGSLANQTADAYSDIDFRIVVDDVINPSDVLVHCFKELTDCLFMEEQYAHFAVVHFRQFVKLDLFIYQKKQVQPSLWLKDIAILRDEGDYLQTIKEASQALEFTVEQDQLDEYLSKYYAYLHEWVRRTKRAEKTYALHCLLGMRHILVSLSYLNQSLLPNSLGDWSKYEGQKSHLDAEVASLCSKYPVENRDMEALTEAVRQEALLLAKTYQLEVDLDQFEDVVRLYRKYGS
ncbi:nucleotidyltransferase domain-containing protein [Streptococcus pneumoniae]